MKEMETLKHLLEQALPAATVVLDAPSPKQTNARWWLDVELEGQSVSLDWKQNQGFGLSSTPTEGLGDGPDEILPSVAAALDRVVTLLRNKERTKPPQELLLSRLRQVRRMSQAQMASTLNVRQAAISKMERRSDMYISTLRNAIAALGGDLEIRARFPEGVVGISQFHDLQEGRPIGTARARVTGSGHGQRRKAQQGVYRRRRA
jgi:transcriptional regulator with XRE-family HTH domain